MVKILIDTQTPACPELNFCPSPASCRASLQPSPSRDGRSSPRLLQGSLLALSGPTGRVRVRPLPPLDGVAEHLPLGFPDSALPPTPSFQYSNQNDAFQPKSGVSLLLISSVHPPPPFNWEQKPELCNRRPQGARDPGASPQLTGPAPSCAPASGTSLAQLLAFSSEGRLSALPDLLFWLVSSPHRFTTSTTLGVG